MVKVFARIAFVDDKPIICFGVVIFGLKKKFFEEELGFLTVCKVFCIRCVQHTPFSLWQVFLLGFFSTYH